MSHAIWLLLALRAVAADNEFVSLRVEPAERNLTGEGAHQQLLVMGRLADGSERDLTGRTEWIVSPPDHARVNAAGLLSATADGDVSVTASVAGKQAQARFQLRGINEARPFEFGREIGRIFTRKGCNSPACHGGVKGRGGFKLSAGALYPRDDYEWITKGGAYRVLTMEVKGPRVPRINLTEPEMSLLLMKPTASVPHGGGLRFRKDSDEYRTLLQWIRRGAPFGAATTTDNRVARLEVFPPIVTLDRGGEQRLLVTAHFADGRQEDFTDEAVFSSGDREIGAVNDSGVVQAGRLGETVILVRAAGQAASAIVGVIGPPLKDFTKVERANFVDDFVFDKLRRFRLPPSPLSSDAEFLRRVCLDLTGTLPPPERVRLFLASQDPRKRANLVDTLLATPEFVDYWTFRFSDLFRVSVVANGVSPKWSEMYSEWIRQSIAANKPYDQMARERIAAQGYDGPTRHYLPFDIIGPPGDTMAEEVRVFFGRRLDCAQCHNHPFEAWSQDQYWGMAAFFGRQFMLRGTTDTDREYVVFDRPLDEDLGNKDVGRAWPKVIQPRTKVEMKPTLLDGTVVDAGSRQNPRIALADWMVKQPYFAEATVNRIWSYFFGRGFVDPVDDFRSTNPPTHPELLARLADDFRAHGYDLRHLMKMIVTSATYQLSGQARPENREDRTNYSHALPRPLDAEILLDAICDVTGVPETFRTETSESNQKTGQTPYGTRVMDLREPDLFHSRFLDVFGRPSRLTVPERSSKPNLGEALDMLAGPVYNDKLTAPASRLQRFIKTGKADREIIEEFYLAAFARRPQPEEAGAAEKLTESQPDRSTGLQQFVWAVLCSREFAENH